MDAQRRFRAESLTDEYSRKWGLNAATRSAQAPAYIGVERATLPRSLFTKQTPESIFRRS